MDERRLIEGLWIRWNAARAQAAYAQGHWVRHGLGDTLTRTAEREPARVLIVDGDVRVESGVLYRRAAALARALLRRGKPGSVVSFMLPNWHEAATIYLAAHLAGMIANPILPSLRDRELGFILNDLRSTFVFVPQRFRGYDYVAMMSRITPQLANPPMVAVVRGEASEHVSYLSLLLEDATTELPSVDPDAVRLVLYTSGTTGTPKGVLHSQNSIHALIQQIGRFWRVEAGDAFLVPSPISHIGGSIYAFEAPLLLGTKAVLLDRWDADTALDLMIEEGCTHMAGATPFLRQLLDAARRAGTRLHGLKVFVCGGASVPPSLIRDAAAHFDRTLFTRVYGSTEVPVTTVGTLDRADLAHASESDGRVGFGEVKLVEGEIRARGPQMFVGYLHPEDEAAAFDEEGYYRTGDLGRWADGEYLVVTGRAKDIIIRKGENISPKEVEDVLVEHPNIAEVAVVGLPDDERGERACAAIVPRQLPGPDVAELRAFSKSVGLAAFKVPEQVVAMERLPKNDAGKVLKHALKALLLREAPHVDGPAGSR